ncbi:hypothetical protein TRIP_B200003 [uncultured Desulfatiglans sp.]|nr:hypothetical protein TRIP_B200003 [uncultured Desulfatiglans sp.]
MYLWAGEAKFTRVSLGVSLHGSDPRGEISIPCYACRNLSGIFPDGGSTPPASTNKNM